jgi:cyclic pyranopterin phosphate synthase
MSWDDAAFVIDEWLKGGLKNVRFSGGEPTLWPHLTKLVKRANDGGVERIAVSTNGSAPLALYEELINAGVSDFSVSFDACCAADCGTMSGWRGDFDHIKSAIRFMSDRTYVTAGVVLTDDNKDHVNDIVNAAKFLGGG